MKFENSTKKYFDKVPEKWDSLYSRENFLAYTLNRLLRKGLFDRYNLTFKHCKNVEGKKVLDIGCGTGRYSIEFAKKGAEVVGIDFSKNMIDFSRKIAEKMKLERYKFILDDFLAHNFKERFDIVIAIGFFDYVKLDLLELKKIYNLTKEIFVASFPKPRLIWDIQRKIRYNLIKRCRIYSYTKEQLIFLYRQAGFKNFKIIPIGGGYFVVAYKK